MYTVDIENSKALENGIDVHKLKPGTMVIAVTKNNLYKITKGSKDQYDVTVQGGKFFRQPTSANFSGSTFGGSMMKIGWIGYGMYMEIHANGKKVRTTGVRAAKIVGDGWEYDMEWNKMSGVKIIKKGGR